MFLFRNFFFRCICFVVHTELAYNLALPYLRIHQNLLGLFSLHDLCLTSWGENR